MSWLRRIFGGGSGLEGRGHGQGDVPLAQAKPKLLHLLRERGARSAIVGYDGGHDEGGVTSLQLSREPLGVEARDWSGDSLPNAESLNLERAYEAAYPVPGMREPSEEDRRLGELLEAAEAVVCDKWGSFAGEFSVRGRLVVDVDAEAIARHDEFWLDREEDFDEDEQEHPSRAPDGRETEVL